MVRKYLKIQVEGKNMLIDLSILPSSKVKFSLGKVEDKEFIQEREISLDKLEVLEW